MAVLSSLGGITSTYINSLSDAVQAILGFPGGTQWAAGLHILWIVLATALTRKTGTGTLTGVLKGAVELLSGNSHGVIILLVDIVAGLFVDFGFLIFKNKNRFLAYLLAGGLASASNVLVFQLFSTLPGNILALGAILVLFLVAMVSGFLFGGLLPMLLIKPLNKAGVISLDDPQPGGTKWGWAIVMSVLILAGLFGVFLKMNFSGPEKIEILGDVAQPTSFPYEQENPQLTTREIRYRGVMTAYTGYPLSDILQAVQPSENADTLLITASDGYAFLISFEEIENNPNILLVEQGKGENAAYDIVGPISSKAWVRNVTSLTVIAAEDLVMTGRNGETASFDPDAWLDTMDSTQINLPDGSQKLQGVPVWKILDQMLMISTNDPEAITFHNQTESTSLPWSEVDQNDDLRIFTVVGIQDITYAIAEMSGSVILYPVSEIEIE
jgi:energy-coupling factor transport system substrate-specific component